MGSFGEFEEVGWPIHRPSYCLFLASDEEGFAFQDVAEMVPRCDCGLRQAEPEGAANANLAGDTCLATTFLNDSPHDREALARHHALPNHWPDVLP